MNDLNDYGCDKCCERFDFDKEIVWVLSSYGLCYNCYVKTSEEDLKKIRSGE